MSVCLWWSRLGICLQASAIYKNYSVSSDPLCLNKKSKKTSEIWCLLILSFHKIVPVNKVSKYLSTKLGMFSKILYQEKNVGHNFFNDLHIFIQRHTPNPNLLTKFHGITKHKKFTQWLLEWTYCKILSTDHDVLSYYGIHVNLVSSLPFNTNNLSQNSIHKIFKTVNKQITKNHVL